MVYKEIMATPPQGQSEQEIVDVNPRRRKADITSDIRLIRWVKLRIKRNNPEALSNVIFPASEVHGYGSFTLGAQLLEDDLDHRRDKAEAEGRSLLRVTMLTDREKVKSKKEKSSDVLNKKTFDHGVFDPIKGKNISVADMKSFLGQIHGQMKTDPKRDVYCHCMAGRSRSQFTTIGFAYFHPNKEALFDFKTQEWGKIWDGAETKLRGSLEKSLKRNMGGGLKHRTPHPEIVRDEILKIVNGLPAGLKKNFEDRLASGSKEDLSQIIQDLPIGTYIEGLKDRLQNNPSPTDIGEYILLQRPKVKPLDKLEGDQGGSLRAYGLKQNGRKFM